MATIAKRSFGGVLTLAQSHVLRFIQLEFQWGHAGALLMGTIAKRLFLRMAATAPPVTSRRQIQYRRFLVCDFRFTHSCSFSFPVVGCRTYFFFFFALPLDGEAGFFAFLVFAL